MAAHAPMRQAEKKEQAMKPQFDKKDIVVVTTAYGQRIVRTEHPDDKDVALFVLVDKDSNMEDRIEFAGSLKQCLSELGTHQGFEIALSTEPILWSPDENINGLISRA
jgi:hypothetical protein